MRDPGLERRCVDTARMLAVDAVEAARSGHPGMPLGAAPMAHVLFHRIMRHNPADPTWFNRDRFILSAGHGSALLYAMLHLTGYDLPLSELKRFRQWRSRTPGHPEYGHTPGVEATTGPLGQGFGMGVGIAMAERYLAKTFNRDQFPIIDHRTYAIVSDGDLMEGISAEAASLAGHLKLGKLLYLYDSNRISIDGSTDLAFTEDVAKRFESYRWHVLHVDDGNDLDAIDRAIRIAQQEAERPSLILVKTHIGFGSPKQDDADSHGSPLGSAATLKTKQFYHWPTDATFVVPPEVQTTIAAVREGGIALQQTWTNLFNAYQDAFPADGRELKRLLEKRLPDNFRTWVSSFSPDSKPMATRSASGKVMNSLAKGLPELIGGSADLTPSTKTELIGYPDRNIHFGVREHGMGAIVNGMALHGGLIPFGATFFIFSDYMRASVRLAALMNIHSIFVFTHDSVGLGEDGPTHQPVEHLASLRAMPNLTLLRPADANETAAAWEIALLQKGPVALVLSRQDLPILKNSFDQIREGVHRGAYVVSDCDPPIDLMLIATGSELSLALEAQIELGKGYRVRVVSMPSWDLFAKQSEAYRNQVLPPMATRRLSIEAGSSFGWQTYVGPNGESLSIDQFGASAPGEVVLSNYGFNCETIVKRALDLLARGGFS